MNLCDLPIGHRVFVEFPGLVYRGVVIEQMPRDRWVRVESDAAKQIRAYWTALSFRWEDGMAAAGMGHGKLIVPETEEEGQIWEARVKQREREDAAKLARRHVPASDQAEMWWEKD